MSTQTLSKLSNQILIADDDSAILDATRMILEYEGYEVQTTTDGESVVKLFKNPPRLLLLDILMSGNNGTDVCKALKAKKTTRHVPIIMISASRDVEESARTAGADDFIAKPFEMKMLLAKVKKHILK